jgi:hypothetical protein
MRWRRLRAAVSHPPRPGGLGSPSGPTTWLCRTDGWTRPGRTRAKARWIRDAPAPVLSRKHGPLAPNRRDGAPQGDALLLARGSETTHLRLAALRLPSRAEEMFSVKPRAFAPRGRCGVCCLTIEDEQDAASPPMSSPRRRGPINTASSTEARNVVLGKPTTLRESGSPPARGRRRDMQCA